MKSNVSFTIAVLLSLFFSLTGYANDLLVGSYEGTWCNYKARFEIETREQNRWVFHGNILIHQTGQLDPLWIEQYSDNSLRIIRYLQGPRHGQTQVVQTYPPETHVRRGRTYHVFRSQSSHGYGCSGTATEMWMRGG